MFSAFYGSIYTAYRMRYAIQNVLYRHAYMYAVCIATQYIDYAYLKAALDKKPWCCMYMYMHRETIQVRGVTTMRQRRQLTPHFFRPL